MYDDMVQLLSPLLIVAAMAATQIAPSLFHDMSASGWTNPAVAESCHGTRVGNARGSTCPGLSAQR